MEPLEKSSVAKILWRHRKLSYLSNGSGFKSFGDVMKEL